MIDNIKNSFLSIVQNSDWMDQETKANTLKKVIRVHKLEERGKNGPRGANMDQKGPIWTKGACKTVLYARYFSQNSFVIFFILQLFYSL